MSQPNVLPVKFEEMFDILKGDIDAFNSLYQLKTNNEEELNSIYKVLKTILLESKMCLPQFILERISIIAKYNNLYMKSYLFLAKQIYDYYHPERIRNITPIFDYLFYKEYGIVLDEREKERFRYFEQKNYTSNVHEENTIYRAIMEDDKKSFISFTERKGFDKDEVLYSYFYPNNTYDEYHKNSYTLLELCCYYGSIDCFKFLISEYKSIITLKCLPFSFLSGNPEIMSECLKYQEPNRNCMEYAIISHNIDFVTFLMNEYKIEINLELCGNYNNFHAFFVWLLIFQTFIHDLLISA